MLVDISVEDHDVMSSKRVAALLGGVLLLLVLVIGSQFGYLSREVGWPVAGVAIVGFVLMSWLGARERATDSDGRREPGWWRERGPTDNKLVVGVWFPAIALGLFAGVTALATGAWPAGLVILGAISLLAFAVRWWAKNTH
jgi:hypothetical protein